MVASKTDGISSVCGYFIGIKCNQDLEIEFDEERKKIDTKDLIYRDIFYHA